MQVNYLPETETPGRRVGEDQLQIICHRYYLASKFVQGKRVLEVGCGPGLGLGYLSEEAKIVVGGDITRESLICAQKHYRGSVGLVSLDAHRLPFKNRCFDVVLAVAVIIYLDLPNFLDECHRILKKKAVLILNTPNKEIPGFRESTLSCRYYSAYELFTLLDNHNFEADLYGAFPMVTGSEGVARQNPLQVIMRTGGKTLDLIPKGGEIKNILGDVLFHKITLKAELEEEDMKRVEDIHLVPIPRNSPDLRHRILYVIAHPR